MLGTRHTPGMYHVLLSTLGRTLRLSEVSQAGARGRELFLGLADIGGRLPECLVGLLMLA